MAGWWDDGGAGDRRTSEDREPGHVMERDAHQPVVGGLVAHRPRPGTGRLERIVGRPSTQPAAKHYARNELR